MPVRLVPPRRLNQTGEEGRFGEVQVVDFLAEIVARRRPHADDRDRPPLRQIDLVQVPFEDLRLGVKRLEAQGRQALPELPVQVPIAAVGIEVLGQLLRDGAAALNHLAALHVGEQGAQHPLRIDPEVAIEAPILHRHHGVEQGPRQVGGRDRQPLLMDVAREGAERLRLDPHRLEIVARRQVLETRDPAEPEPNPHRQRRGRTLRIVEGVQVDLVAAKAPGELAGDLRMPLDLPVPETRQPLREVIPTEGQTPRQNERGGEEPDRRRRFQAGEPPVGVDEGDGQDPRQQDGAGQRQPQPPSQPGWRRISATFTACGAATGDHRPPSGTRGMVASGKRLG